MMVVCPFWQRGHCKFGDKCRNDHFDNSNGGGGGGQQRNQNQGGQNNRQNNNNNNNNRFQSLNNNHNQNQSSPFQRNQNQTQNQNAPFGRGQNQNPTNFFQRNQTQGNQGSQGNQQGGGGGRRGNDPNYGVTTTQIEDDLTKDRPMWLLSCYGPGKNAPRQLFGGQPREQSFEEMRVRAYELGSAGNIAQYQQEEAELIRIAEEQVLKAVKESRNAVKFVADGDKEHPNRHDIVNKLENHSTDTGGAPFAGNPFANVGHQASTGGFNQPANNPPPAVDPFRVSPFSTPAPQQGFGFQNMPATTTATAFGGPTTLGSGTFGQATQLGNNTFGQPGQSGAPSTGFTQQQAPSFGSNLSVPQNPQGFSQPNNASAPQQPTGASGFPFNAPQWKTTPQAPASMQSNPTQPQPALFGQPFSQTSNILGTSAAPQQFGVSGFPSTNSNGSTAPSVAPVAQAPTPALQSLPGSGQPLVPGQPNPNATYSCDGRLLTWHNQPVTWVDGEPCIKRPQDGLLQRIWFPNGAPVPGRAPLPEEEIGFGRPDDLVLMERYKRASQMGDWDDEGVPELSPRREWVDYDM